MRHLRHYLIVCLVGLLLAACDRDREPVSQAPDDGFPPGTVSDPPDANPDLADQVFDCTDLPPLPAPSRVTLEPVFPQVRGARGDFIVHAEESHAEPGRWYTVHQQGQIYTFREEDEAATLALDVASLLWTDDPEAGIVSMALSPDFATSGEAYILYSADVQPPGFPFVSRLARVKSEDGGKTFELSSLEVVLDVPQPKPSHSVNHLRFGPDGMLYISLGDGANPYDRLGHGQDPTVLYGSILRIDPRDRTDGPYGIPADNPYADGVDGAPEVWAWGLRNPWRFSFDRETGEVWAGDVGQDSREEVNLIVAGGNYGWSIKEGELCFNDPNCEQATGIIDPVFAYSHSLGASVTGGYVYRGEAIPELHGRYIFGDFAAGTVWALREGENGQISAEVLAESKVKISSFAEDLDGEVYLIAYSYEGEGGLFKLAPSKASAYVGEFKLSQTGCVNPDAPSTLAEVMVPYGVNAPLWSDGAQKRRALALPEGARVEVDDAGDVIFPVGSVLFKEFAYDGKPHETRLMVKHDEGWAAYSFAWDEDGEDATLLSFGESTTLSGGQPWTYPTRGACFRCHTAEANFVLGVEMPQLVGNESGEDALEAMSERGWLSPGAEAWAGEVFVAPDSESPLEARVRSYLHSNCAGCHRPGVAAVRSEMDLRYTTPFADTKTCGLEPEHGSLYGAVKNAQIIRPGVPEESVFYRRMTTLEVFRMPQLGTSVVDEQGSELVRQWIEGMEGCE